MTEPVPAADCVVPPSADFVRQYLRANLFDGDESGTLTVKISDHLDFLVELTIDLCLIQSHPAHNDGKMCGS